MDLVDIGINLAHDSYAGDRAAVIARATAAGVTQLIVTGATLASSRAALELARAHPGQLFATAGVHPHQAGELTAAELPQLRALLGEPGVVAAGECGLDYFRNYSPPPAQRHAFAGRRSCRPPWIWACTSASPDGSATSGAVRTCKRW